MQNDRLDAIGLAQNLRAGHLPKMRRWGPGPGRGARGDARTPAPSGSGHQRGCGISHPLGLEPLPRWACAPVVQALRRISILNAITLGAGIGSFGGLEKPAPADGLVGSGVAGAFERQHGPTRNDRPDRQQAGAGNSLAPAGLVELPWTYRFAAWVSRVIRKRTSVCPSPSGWWGARRRPGSAGAIATAWRPAGPSPIKVRQGGRCHCPRDRRLHLGHRPHGRAGPHMIEHRQHRAAKEAMRPESARHG